MGEPYSVGPNRWLGRSYLYALQRARLAGEGPRRVVLTRPPYPGWGAGELRVVGVRPLAPERRDGCEWILANPRFLRPPKREGKR